MTELATSRLRLLGAILAALASGITLARTIRDERSKATAKAAELLLREIDEAAAAMAAAASAARHQIVQLNQLLAEATEKSAKPEGFVFVDDPLPKKGRVIIDADGNAFADGPPLDKHRSIAGTEDDPHAVFVEGNV